jgi:microcompartment protein CcmL/EutN
MYEAIGLLEVQSIACGIDVADAMLKAAPVDFIDTFMASPGKFVVLVHGDPSAVESSLRAGIASAGDQQLDSLIIPFIDPQVFKAIRLQAEVTELAAIGVIETSTVASGILAADAAAKAADVRLLALHLARGIGGKSVLTLTGRLHEVQAGIDAGSAPATATQRLVATRIIANPHPDLAARVLAGSRPASA